MTERAPDPVCCDPFKHQWAEEYYGQRCSICGTFIAFGCEPWLPDHDIEEGLDAGEWNNADREKEQPK